LAHDFGAALGCGAHLSLLRRTGIGDFSVDDACTVDEWLKEIQSDRNDSADLHNNQNA
jgi:tRNA pseudouridine55 synthase